MSTVPSTSPPTSPPAPSWLAQLLDAKTLPTLPLPGASHNKPRHPDLTPLISDGHFHPALEAALHLANGDLYSAHFLVRKAQGGARELDWGHALLHRLEGDMGNAKVSVRRRSLSARRRSDVRSCAVISTGRERR